jgi:hypothetical protein
MAKEWTFKVFISERGSDVFEEWLNTLPKKAQAKIERRIRYLEIEKTWRRPFFDSLSGYTDLYEIRVVFNNIQYRPIGCFGPKSGEFTILIGAIEKGDKFEPKNALNIANKRSKLIAKEGYTNEY